jgi:type IV secretory pathway VirB4 component
MANSFRATQEFVPIEDIRNGVILMKDGGMKAILLCTSINFSLKSDDERVAILSQFQDFVNSLDFSVQIFVQSRKLDIRPYLALLENQKKNQTNDLMKLQIQEYVDFIRSFTENTNIMTKGFFVVVPYTPAIMQSGGSKGVLSNILPHKTKESKVELNEANFEEHRTQLEQRLSVVEQGLMRCGLRILKLGTEEIIELFYKIFNPGDTEKPIQLADKPTN